MQGRGCGQAVPRGLELETWEGSDRWAQYYSVQLSLVQIFVWLRQAYNARRFPDNVVVVLRLPLRKHLEWVIVHSYCVYVTNLKDDGSYYI